jgi:hypothetical protein
MMFTCKTENCPMGDEKHSAHPEGLALICCFCSQELTPDE